MSTNLKPCSHSYLVCVIKRISISDQSMIFCAFLCKRMIREFFQCILNECFFAPIIMKNRFQKDSNIFLDLHRDINIFGNGVTISAIKIL